MKKIAVIALFIFVAFGLFFLKKNFDLKSKGETKEANITLTWEYTPKQIDLQTPVNFSFTLKDQQGNNVDNAKIDIEATMNHGGMIPVFNEAKFVKDALYTSTFKLTMLGEWILFLTITLPDGSVAHKEVVLQTN